MANKELDPTMDKSKRRFLIAATSVVGAAGAAVAAVPFVTSMLPSERASCRRTS